MVQNILLLAIGEDSFLGLLYLSLFAGEIEVILCNLQFASQLQACNRKWKFQLDLIRCTIGHSCMFVFIKEDKKAE